MMYFEQSLLALSEFDGPFEEKLELIMFVDD